MQLHTLWDTRMCRIGHEVCLGRLFVFWSGKSIYYLPLPQKKTTVKAEYWTSHSRLRMLYAVAQENSHTLLLRTLFWLESSVFR